MDEASKSKKIWGPLELGVLQGDGIDIGCGPDPVLPGVHRFDKEDGDANAVTKFVKGQFDFVFSSHCLEHMKDPACALREWWQLVKPGGHLFFIVPDEDLYEQGVFPSRFNPDHKATFTLSKRTSWSPSSHNVFDLARSLPGSEIVSLELQDAGYDRSLQRHDANQPKKTCRPRLLTRILRALRHRGFPVPDPEAPSRAGGPTIDQTMEGALAQIQCIVRKSASPE